MAPHKPNDYLALSDVFHPTFIAVDEAGTEAAAATAALGQLMLGAVKRYEPIQVRGDRPFLFAGSAPRERGESFLRANFGTALVPLRSRK
jgi:serine protease inhibitor